MQLAHLSALIRAVSQLRTPGAPDPHLLDALALLLAPRPEPARDTTARASGDDRPGPQHPARPRATAPDEAPAGPLPDMPATESAATRSATQRRTAPDPHKLVALASSWTPLATRADLAAPPRSQAGPASADPPALDAPGAPAPLESLFPAHRVRAILRDLATVSKPSGQPDVVAAVQMIARAEPIQLLPQRIRSALGHTTVLLFDAGPAMLPFARDKQQLAATALRLLGKDRVRVHDFLGDPMRGVRAQRQVRWEAMRWPGRGSTLVLVSDLGIGENHPERALGSEPGLHFLDECGRRGLRSVVLIPYGPARWPALAARFDVALTWDLDTGVQALRRSLRQHP